MAVTVLQAAKVLLGVCDGAVTKDGQGFNKFDARFVRDIVERGRELTERQEQFIHKTLRKYQVQLASYQIEYNQIQLTVRTQPEKPSLQANPQAMILDFKADPRLPKFILHSQYDFRVKAKAIPTAFWDTEEKVWTYSNTLQFFEAIRPYLVDGTIKDTPAARPALIELGRALRAVKAGRQAVQSIKDSPVANENGMPVKLKPFLHQTKAFLIGTTVPQAALLMEQGTGKTLSAIAIAGLRYAKGEVQRLLVMAPLSVTSVWVEEFEKVAAFKYQIKNLSKLDGEKRIQALNQFDPGCLQVAVINYESSWRLFDSLVKWKPQMIIADESQRIKNGQAKQSKALHKLGEPVPYKLILSGTPVTQGPLDVWSQYRFLNPDIFGKKFLKFRERYATMGGYGGYQVLGYKELPELAEKAHSIAYRVTKEEALDLPPQMDQIIKVELEPEAQKLYDQMERDFIIRFSGNETATAPIVLTQLLRLQQITGGFIPVDENETVKSLSQAKLKVVSELLDDLPSSKKVVIFARFTAEIEALENLAEKLNRGFVTISGSTTNRATAISSFQTDPKTTILIAQIQTGGLGITLTASDTVIFYSTTFSFADYEQAKARVHRIGQSKTVTYIHILAEGTIDEEILKILKSKGNMARLVVDTLSRKFSKKPFTSTQDADKINLTENKKEGNKMLEETMTGTTDEKASDLKEKLQKIKAKSETKAPAAKKVAEKPQVSKNKVKEPKAEKKEKKLSKTGNPKLVLLKDLAAELGLDPREVRKKLRKDFKREEGSSWSWEKGDAELAEIRKALKEIAKGKAKK